MEGLPKNIGQKVQENISSGNKKYRDNLAGGLRTLRENDQPEMAKRLLYLEKNKNGGLFNEYNYASGEIIDERKRALCKDDMEFVDKLIDAGETEKVMSNLDSLNVSLSEVANRLMDREQYHYLVKYIGKFKEIDNNELAKILINSGNKEIVRDNLRRLRNLDMEVFNAVVNWGNADVIIAMGELSSFDIPRNELAFKLIDKDLGSSVLENLEAFRGVEHNKLAKKMLDSGDSFTLIQHLEKLDRLDLEVAWRIIKKGYVSEVVKNYNKFEGLNDKELINLIIRARKGDYVLENLEAFSQVDHNDIVQKIMDTSKWAYVLRYIEKIKGVDHNDIVQKIIKEKGEEGERQVQYFFDKLKNLNEETMALLEK